MAESLVIVESPAKAKTINRYLGSGYKVMASMGHVRDLPKSKLGVDLANDFAPQYIVIPERRAIVSELKSAAQKADAIILAADPDREGEAICWHLKAIFEEDGAAKPIGRVLLHEITKPAIEQAIGKVGPLDRSLFNAQQTRRILDRLVGYQISPLLWKKVSRGLSAGRVQSIALRIIVEREKEIRAFVPEEYWTIYAHLAASHPPPFRAALAKIDGKKAKVPNQAAADAILIDLKTSDFVLDQVKVQEKKRTPSPPYTTSTLQQEAYRLLRYPVKRTMSIAQKLYEGLPIGDRGPVGLITYMRTDSVRVSPEAQAWARTCIANRFSAAHVPAHPPVYKNKSQAQDAHEAVRPTTCDLSPDVVKPYLKPEEYRLYELIWRRFMASQMSPAVVEETEFGIKAGRYLFTAKGEVMKFAGYTAVYPNRENGDKETLPPAAAGETLSLDGAGIEPKQSFTQPPARFTEGTLVKELEAKGIGRPSTYAPIIATIQNRTYVHKDQGKFIPTELGIFVTDFLIKNFPDLMEVRFTALMEEELDKIEEGADWHAALKEYQTRLSVDLKAAGEVASVKATGIPLEETCPKCGKSLVLKGGKYGQFKACSGYPECDYKDSMIKKEVIPLDEKCPECQAQLVERFGRFGRFVACSNYPTCKYIKKKERTDTGIACPNACGGTILKRETRRKKYFYGCSSFPKCRYATWDEPVARPCPKCGKPFLLQKTSKKDGTYVHCIDEVCGYRDPEKAASPPKKERAHRGGGGGGTVSGGAPESSPAAPADEVPPDAASETAPGAGPGPASSPSPGDTPGSGE